MLSLPAVTIAQDTGRAVVAEAARLRDSGDMAGALRLLRPYVVQHPEDVGAARVLAQSLYWSKDADAARTVYETALARNGDDVALRLEFGQMLVETGAYDRATDVLGPVQRAPAARGRAAALLGTMAYWRGDLTAARDLFLIALAADSTRPEVRRQLGEIASVTAPWIRVAPELRHDDQPLDRAAITAEAGWFATPLTPVTLHVTSAQFTARDSPTVGVTTADITLTHAMPVRRIDVEFGGGAVAGASGRSTDWTGRVGVGLRLPDHFVVRVRDVRERYLYTLASLTSPVMTQTATAMLGWDRSPGWLGEAAVQRQSYPDGNAIATAYAWVLAPIARGTAGALQAGYAFSAQNAESGRFVLANPSQPYPPSDPRFSTAGRYAPYYTPSHLQTHSAVAAATLHLGATATLHVNGSVGIHATDVAPVFDIVTGTGGSAATVVVSSYPRTFTPWNGHVALDFGSVHGPQWSIVGDAVKTTFYTSLTVGVQLTYRFVGGAERHAAP